MRDNTNGSTNLYDILSNDLFDHRSDALDYIQKSVKRNKLLVEAIQTGNKKLLDKVMQMPKIDNQNRYYYGNPIIKDNPLRTQKNDMIIRNTMCRIAGEMGGVCAIYLQLVSEKYALQIEQATSANYLEEVISPQMFSEYCDLVANYSIANYSFLIKEIVDYIGNHLHKELNVTKLSQTFHINSSHLARKFKKDTGLTISEYVNKLKVQAAKLLFQGGCVTVGEVSERLGYNSTSYFSKIFKKIVGESPAAYQKKQDN